MNAPTDTQQPEAPKARRFTGPKRTLVIAGAAGALILGGGTAAAFAADLDDNEERGGVAENDVDDRFDDRDDADDANGTDDDFALPADAIGEDAAVEAALAAVPGEVYDVDLEGTAEAPLWIVEVTDADGAEWDVTVDALDGAVAEVLLDDGADDTDDKDDLNDDDGDDTDDATDDQDDNDDD
jgi:uncharacterized membrane protein YkoI